MNVLVRIFKASMALVICRLQSLCLHKEIEEKAENLGRTPKPKTGLKTPDANILDSSSVYALR
jgi:hypothetical protein